MSNALSRFEDEFWGSTEQVEVFRHLQALRWLHSLSGPVLDVGCGDGFFLSRLKERGIEAWGVDISSTAIERARSKGLHVLVSDFDSGTLPEGKARTAVLLDVLEHMYDPKPILQALRVRVGTLIVSVPNFVSLPARWQVLRGRVPENNTPKKGHVYWYTYHILEKRLMENGWEIEESAFNPPWMKKPIIGFFMRVAVRVFPGLFALSFVVKAKHR